MLEDASDVGKLLKNPNNAKILEINDTFDSYSSKIDLWSDIHIWIIENEECYSDWWKQYIQYLRPILIEFVKEGYTVLVSKKYNIEYHFLRYVAYWVSKCERIGESLFKANGFKGKLGLEYAQAQLKIFYKEYNRLPVQRDKEMVTIVKTLTKKKYWKEYGINTWSDLLMTTFGRTNYQSYTHKLSLTIVKRQLNEFYLKYNRLPTARDVGMGPIVDAIIRKHWQKSGISTWNDLLMQVFKSVNKDYEIYKGWKGLNKAKKKLKSFYKEYNKLPKSTDSGMQSITKALNRKYWAEFNINTWNDLMNTSIGKINRRYSIWTGKKGLERAMALLKDFYQEHRRTPVRRDKGMESIAKAIQRGYWKDYGILSWSQLVQKSIVI